MSAQKLQAALGLLQDDPDNEQVWNEIAEAVASSDAPPPELKSWLEAARRSYEIRREWDAVAKVLDLEARLHAGTPVELAMRFELSRVLDEECFETEKAEAVYRAVLELRPDESSAAQALETHAHARENFRGLAAQALEEAKGASDPAQASQELTRAAETLYRFGEEESREELIAHLEEALRLDSKNQRAAALLERVFRESERWRDAIRVAEIVAGRDPKKEGRAAAWLRIARIALQKLDDQARATDAYASVLDLLPGHKQAMAFLSEHFSKNEQWDHLVALYEDQLRGGGVEPAEEAGIVFQIAMVNWRMRQDPRAAEPWFDRLRRLTPAHPAVLDYFREQCQGDEGKFRLLTILSDAQRAMSDGPDKASLAAEIAKLAEEGANAQKAIEQYKTLLRAEPENEEARAALKRLYMQTGGWNALIELLRQELERIPEGDDAARAEILREIAAVYRDHIKSDTALVTVLSQLVQIDETDLDSLRELLRAYEALGRFRDLLNHQTKLARALPLGDEKTALLRNVAQRWMTQFSNVQNAIDSYEALLEVEPLDAEAISKLRELYLKRRAFAPLYALHERELPSKEGAERHELLAEMAKIAADRLDRGADAIRLYKEILAEDSSRVDILDLLERQAERERDFATVAEALERRLELSADDAARIAILQKLGAVHVDRLQDHQGAARAFRRILEIQPGHGRALRVLRDAYLAGGDFDGLTELYASQNDWEGLAEVLSNAADRAGEPELKIALSFRAARVFVEELGSPERAFRSYERVLSVEPSNREAAEALVPLYEKDDKWARLPALYEVLLEHREGAEKIALYEQLIEISGKRLNDPEAALEHARRAHEFGESSQTLEMLEEASRAAKSWDAYIAAIEKMLGRKGKKKPKAAMRRSLRAKLAKLYADELGRVDEAVAALKPLVEEHPDDEEAIATLDRLLRSSGKQDDLRWLFELRVGAATADEIRAELLIDWASLEEDAFAAPERATELYRRALLALPGQRDASRALTRLLLAAEDAAGAAEALEASREYLSGKEGADNELALAELYLRKLLRPESALDSLERALDWSPGERRALALLDELVALPETRAQAARLLEREYASVGDADQESRAIAILLETAKEPGQRLDLFLKLAEIHEEKRNAPAEAFDALLRAISELPDELSLWDRAADLVDRAGKAGELAEAYRVALDAESSVADSLRIELCERAAKLHDEKLGDPQGATPFLEAMLAQDPANEWAFARLKQIFTAHEKWGDLEAAYALAAQATTDPSRRIELLHEVALVCEEITNEPKKAVGYYERILELEPVHEIAIFALDRLYADQGLWEKLGASLENRLSLAHPDETIALKLRLARLKLERLADPERALDHLVDVLGLDPREAEARELLEKTLDLPELRLRAALALEPVYDAGEDARELVRVLEIRLDEADDEGESIDLLHRIAELRDERLGDERGAFGSYAHLVIKDPLDGAIRQRTIEIGRQLGEHAKLAEVLEKAADAADSPDLASELLSEVARIREDSLGDMAAAEATYRKILALDPDNPLLALPASRELSRLYTAAGNFAKLAESLERESQLEDDTEARRLLFFRLAELYEVSLSDPERAVSSLRRRLEDEPSDDDALAALQGLHERAGAFEELAKTLQTRAELSLDAALRKELSLKRARLLGEQIGDYDEALAAWQAIRDEFGPEGETLSMLSMFFEMKELWDELAMTLEEELSLVEEPGESLDLLARLAEVRSARQGDYFGALEALRRALTLDPSHTTSREQLAKLLEVPEARREAAELLKPLYETDGDNARLLEVIEIAIESEDSIPRQLELFEEAIRLAEGPLEDASRAFDLTLTALPHAVTEPEPLPWIERAESLAAATNQWAKLVESLRDLVGEVLDGDAQLEVTLKLAELAKDRLQDRDLARESYVKALDFHADEPRALLALDALYEEAGDTVALLDILGRRADASLDDDERKALFSRKARILESEQEDLEGAIAHYELILDISLEEEAVQALERLYAKAERWGDLVSLHERQLDGEGVDSAEVYVRIAKIHHEYLSDIERAFENIEEARRVDPRNEASIAFLEKLLDENEEAEHRARAAEMLEPIYAQHADFRRVMATIEARLSAEDDPFERRPLLKRLANLQEEQAEDYSAALETTAQLFRDDIFDDEALAELERLAKAAGKESRLVEIFAAELSTRGIDDERMAALARRTGELYASLGNLESALDFYRRALTFEPEHRPTFEAIDAIFVETESHRERADLYREALNHRFDAEERALTLHTLAEIERSSLDELDQAIETYRAILDLDERDARAFDALTTLFGEREQFTDLAELLQRRAEQEESQPRRVELHLELARLYRDKIEDPISALDWYEQIIADSPKHEGALADLERMARGEEQAERAIEILHSVYEDSDDFRPLVALHGRRFELAEDAAEKVAILREVADAWENRGENRSRALDAYKKAFALDPNDGELRAEIERIVEALGAWEQLVEAYEAALPEANDLVRGELLASLARVHDEERGDMRAALNCFLQLSKVDESDPEPLVLADELALLLGDWKALAELLPKRAELSLDDEERAGLYRRIAEIRRDMLGDPEGAIAAYEQSLELDGENLRLLDRLIGLYEAKGDAARLVELYARRIDLAEPSEEELSYRLLFASAKLFEGELDDAREAISNLHRALELRPNEGEILDSLARLLEAEELWPDLLDILRQKASLAETPEERVELRKKIAKIHASELADTAEAIEMYRLVLDEAPKDDETVEALLRLGEADDDHRLSIASALEPILRATEAWETLTRALRLRLEAEDSADRARTLQKIATVFDESLGRPGDALQALLEAFSETPLDGGLHDEIERLAEKSSSFALYADALEERASSDFDAKVGLDLWRRLGKISESSLDDSDRAIEAYSKAIEQGGDDGEILARLDALYLAKGENDKLAEILERRVDLEAEPMAQADLLHRLGALQIDALDDEAQGLITLKQALERNPDHAGTRDALEALADSEDRFEEIAEILEDLYREQGESDRLATLYEKRISFAKDRDERVRMRMDLARLLEDREADTRRAQQVLEGALEDSPADLLLIEEIERLAAIHEGWESAAESLGAALSKAEDLDSPTLLTLWLKVAGWQEDKLQNLAGAELAFEKALAENPEDIEILRSLERTQRRDGQEKALVGTLRRLAKLELDPVNQREILREAKGVAERVDDGELAEEVLRQLLEGDPEDLFALEGLSELRERAGDGEELITLLLRRADLLDGSQALELRHRAATIAEEQLDDAERAITLLEQTLELDGTDEHATSELRRLYEANERFEALAKLLRELVTGAQAAEDRNELRLVLAKIQAEKLESVEDAIDTLKAALAEGIDDAAAVVYLSGLYETAERDEDLAALLDSQIARAKAREDNDTELSLTLRLAEMLESRLGKKEEAIEAYRSALSCDGTHREALENLARLLEEAGEHAQATEPLETLVAEAQGEEVVPFALRLTSLYAKLGDDEGMRRSLEKGLEADPSHAEIRESLAKLYERTKDFGSLADLLAQDAEAANENDEKIALYRRAAELHLNKRSDAQAAASLLEKASELAPDDRELLLLLCDAYSASGRGKEAAEALEKIVASFAGRRSKELATVHYRLSRAYRAEGDLERALTELDQAFRIDPGSIPILKELGTLSLETGDLERAQRTYRALLLQRLEPGSPITKGEVFYYLGKISHRLGETARAVQMLERSLENEGSPDEARSLLDELKK